MAVPVVELSTGRPIYHPGAMKMVSNSNSPYDLNSGSVAVIGMACRFPGSSTLGEYAESLAHNVIAVKPLSASRRDLERRAGLEPHGEGNTGTLEGIDLFDRVFFGFSEQEAIAMDPQDRLLLELAWEAIEDSCISTTSLESSQVSVYVATSRKDYVDSRNYCRQVDSRNPYWALGKTKASLPNFVSKAFGLSGESLAVDSGQSSSLVAVDLGCQSIKSGRSNMAIVGAVSLNIGGMNERTLSDLGVVSSRGTCAVLDHLADGIVEGEGGGALVLKDLESAVRDKDKIWAIIRGSLVSYDRYGTRSGPSVSGQKELLSRCYDLAQVSRKHVSYVEMHGTGTPVGDKVEVEALGAVLGRGSSRGDKLIVGSVKSNLGHLDSAAGMAGIIKTILSLKSRTLYPTPTHLRPRADVDLNELCIEVNSAFRAWTVSDIEARIAGVSSFGVSGTIAHVIVEEAPNLEGHTPAASSVEMAFTPPVTPWVISARTPGALRGQARRLSTWSSSGPGAAIPPASIAAKLIHCRQLFENRAVVVGGERTALVEGVRALGAGEVVDQLKIGPTPVRERPAKVAFVFPGQGSHWPTMGHRLAKTFSVYRERLEECASILQPLVEWSLLDVLSSNSLASPLERIDIVQPATFAVMLCLAESWGFLGVEPAAVVGHSQGEITALCYGGALSIRDALELSVARSKSLAELKGSGTMVAVACGVGDIRGIIDGMEGFVAVAAVNGPTSVVLSVHASALIKLERRLREAGLNAKQLPVDVPGHSSCVDQVAAILREDYPANMTGADGVVFYSSVTGEKHEVCDLAVDYWAQNVRKTVNFQLAIESMLGDGFTHFIEVSPHPILTASIEDTAYRLGHTGVYAGGTLTRGDGSAHDLLTSAAQYFVAGGAVDWSQTVNEPPEHVSFFPTYAWDRQSYWRSSAHVPTVGDTVGPLPSSNVPELSDEADAFRDGTAGASFDNVLRTILTLLKKLVDIPNSVPDLVDTPISDLSVDSMKAIVLRNELAHVFRRDLPSTLIFDYPTPRKLAGYLWCGSERQSELTYLPNPGVESENFREASPDDLFAYLDQDLEF